MEIIENRWNPFDPKWYNKAFDKYISGGDELFNINEVIKEGYYVPDADGSRSSVFRNDAVLNNTFNEEILKETLFDIYNNSSHKLIASNHDNTNFFQWHGSFNEINHKPNTDYCDIILPTESFIKQDERDRYKLSQYLEKWISITDVLNNWEIFQWNCLLFINGKVCSEYKFHIDDKNTIIKIPYYEYWDKNNFKIDIYKFSTNAQVRVKISKELVINQWNWKMPVNYIGNNRISSATKILSTINKIGDLLLRDDNNSQVEILSNNIDFLEIKDGYIDLSKMSNSNQIYLESENKEWLWLSLSSPKFLHEYPYLLPSEYLYRPYEADFREVVTLENDLSYKVKSDTNIEVPDRKQVYVDMNGELRENTPLWKRMIRPIVLSDAFNGDIKEDYSDFLKDVDDMKESTIVASDKLDEFKIFLSEYTTDRKFDRLINEVKECINNIHIENHKFMDKYYMEYDEKYENIYGTFTLMVDKIINEGYDSIYLHKPLGDENNFFDICNKCIFYVRDLCDEYNVLRTLSSMPDHTKLMFEDILNNRIRFQRPIAIEDFWTFEFDMDTYTWKPYPLNVEYHFPDVYTFSDPNGNDIENKIFKAFIFYSDTINVTNTSREHSEASPDWSDNIDEYYHNQAGTYRDIFMEKFYWMGIRSIYKGILRTNSRWEVIEYIIDNPSYNRFNELFINTLDPYFKIGLATYLKSNNLNFPLDEEIEKLKEAIDEEFLDYKRVTNFEQYLENDWIPSYFDYVVKILDNWNYASRLIRRPNNMFDINRLLPIIKDIQQEVYDTITTMKSDLSWVMEELKKHEYRIDVNLIDKLLLVTSDMNLNIQKSLDYTLDLDLEIYSIDDINKISNLLNKHFKYTDKVNNILQDILNNVNSNYVAKDKKECLNNIDTIILPLRNKLEEISKIINDFNIDEFLRIANDLNTYLVYDKNNPDDISLIGEINKFEDDWTSIIKEARNNLFKSSTSLLKFINTEIYSATLLEEFLDQVIIVINDINKLEEVIKEFYINKYNNYNPEILSKFYLVNEILNSWKLQLDEYISLRNDIINDINNIRNNLNSLKSYATDNYENEFISNINEYLSSIINDISFIDGNVNKDDIFSKYDKIRYILFDYSSYIDNEIKIFDTILMMGDVSPGYVSKLLDNQELLKATIQYMNSINISYSPDIQLPNFANVYKVDAVHLSTPGFMHHIGDKVYIPNIGVYRINEVKGDISEASIIENLGYYNTSVRNALWNTSEYEGITNGNGVGLKVTPIHVTETKIINDEVVKSFITEIENYYYVILKCLSTPNKYNNGEFSEILDNLNNINIKWNILKNKYSEYMTDNTIEYMNSLMDVILNSIPYCNTFMVERSKINIAKYIELIWNYIVSLYTYTDKNELQDDIFYVYNDKLRRVYTRIEDFYGSGVNWKDSNELKEIITECNLEINSIYGNYIYWITENEGKELFVNSTDEIILLGDFIKDQLSVISESIIPINSYMDNIKDKLINTPKLHKDEWYTISTPGIAVNGENYRVGDIVSVETNQNDILLFQVTKAEFGNVLTVAPIIKYALQYDPYGVYNAITKIGKGDGLKLEIKAHEITLDDNTIITDKGEEYIEPFDENDLFMFTFENAHDLDISYEVFLGGIQTNNFILRHENNPKRYESSAIDVIYINANEVIKLKNSSIQTEAEDYYEFYINNVNIKNPGAGYHEGQTVTVCTDTQSLQMIVDEVELPLKGIKSLGYGNIKLRYAPDDPSVENVEIVSDDMNNIDDEYHQDKLNNTFMHKLYISDNNLIGDPDESWLLGDESNELISQRIDDTIYPIDGIISDDKKLPPNINDLSDIQEIARVMIHNSTNITNDNVTQKELVKNKCIINGDISVPSHDRLPVYSQDFPGATVGSTVIVEHDETHHGHRMLYRVRTYLAYGNIVYDLPEVADYKWNTFDIKWNETDSYSNYPSLNSIYKSILWDTSKTFREVQEAITDRKIINSIPNISKNYSTYIHDLSIDDISIFNWTTKEWEDLNSDRWNIKINDNVDDKDCGFILEYNEDGIYSYDMSLYLNKTPSVQKRNASLKENAIVDISALMGKHTQKPSSNHLVNTGRRLTFRKLFPYYQKENYVIGKMDNGDIIYEIDFKLAPYIHFKNEIHLEDIKIFNKSANRFENILDTRLFEVRIKDDKCNQRGFETNTEVINSYISEPGNGFIDGEAWGYNEEYKCHVFGHIYSNNGNVSSFTVDHIVNPPNVNLPLEFKIYQSYNQLDTQGATIIIEFHTERKEIYGDGYIHNVVNPYAPIKDEFKVIVQYDLDNQNEYEIYIDNRSKKWLYKMPIYINGPEIFLEGEYLNKNHIYISTNNGRFPLVNPLTGKDSFTVTHKDNGTLIKFLNLYRQYEDLEIHYVPYPMRSVYTQRNIPSTGYIDLSGKLNKPLNKKYYEFWANGKLLTDEVNIITPTKLFLHGLTSLKNFEIVEINRDPYEYFSEPFLGITNSRYNHLYKNYNYRTYLDDVLEGKLKGDNYTEEEQEYLLTPIWKQVNDDNPEYMNYPPNIDIDSDILTRTNSNSDISNMTNIDFDYFITNTPTIEGIPLSSNNFKFKHFGFVPITDKEIVNMIIDEYANEIEEDPYFDVPAIITSDDWYGMVARLYNEYGNEVFSLDDSLYKVIDDNILSINTENKLHRIIQNNKKYEI